MHKIVAIFSVVGLLGCGGASPPPETPSNQSSARSSGVAEQDAPEISRSRGVHGGVVVLWPRIVSSRKSPAPVESTAALARQLQQRVASLVRENFPGVPVDVRPEPERVCPRDGCDARSVGLVLTRAGEKGCTATVWVAREGKSGGRLVPWAGGVAIRQDTFGFREPPEELLAVSDQALCDGLVEQTKERDKQVIDLIKSVVQQ